MTGRRSVNKSPESSLLSRQSTAPSPFPSVAEWCAQPQPGLWKSCRWPGLTVPVVQPTQMPSRSVLGSRTTGSYRATINILFCFAEGFSDSMKISVDIASTLHEQLVALGQSEQVTLEDVVLLALAEKVAAAQHREWLRRGLQTLPSDPCA